MSYAIRLLCLGFFVLLSQGIRAQSVAAILESASHQEALWSVTVRSTEGEILESFQPDKAIIPASNQKLVTSAALLDYFGADYRFETNIYGDGRLEGHRWKGDLIIKGSGDPSISGDLYHDDPYHVFNLFLEQLQDAGIQYIEGNILADISLFDEQYYPKGWDWYDMSFYYGVQISPLSFNNNAVDLEVYADGAIGEKPRISWFPDTTGYVTFVNEQLITPPGTDYDEYYRREMGSNTIVLGSTLPKGYVEEEALSVNNPPLFFLHSFRKYLIQQGMKVSGGIQVLPAPATYDTTRVLAQHHSRPLSELVEWLNKESDNFYTEMLVKKLSAESSNQPGSFEDGIQQVRAFLGEMGLDTSYVQMNDGSGMAAGNLNTTAILSELLFQMQEHPDFEAYRNSLSVAGIDGTLAHRMKGTPLYNNFRGKSGFVSGVRTLSGYLEAQSGERLIVSLATNNFISEKVSPIDAVHEQILQYLYRKF